MSTISPTDPRNNKEPQPWAKIDTSRIQAVNIPADATAEDMLNAMKQIAAVSTEILYGNNHDEKTKKILNLISYRMRASMDEFIAACQSSDASSAQQLKQMFTSTKNELLDAIQKASAKEYVYLKHEDYEQLLEKLKAEGKDSSAAQSEVEQQRARDLEWALNEIKQLKEAQQEGGTSKGEAAAALDTAAAQPPAQAAAGKANDVIDAANESVQKLSQACAQAADAAVQSLEAPLAGSAGLSNAAGIRRQLNVIERTDQAMAAVENATAQPAMSVTMSKKSSGIFTTKQFQFVLRLFRSTSAQSNAMVQQQFAQSSKVIKDMSGKIDGVNKKLDTSKFPWMTIILLASAVLVPLFWRKIKEFLSSLEKKFNINGMIDRFVNMIDWDKHVNTLIDRVCGPLLDKVHEWMIDPWSAIVAALKYTWDHIVKWRESISKILEKNIGTALDIISREDAENEKRISSYWASLDKGLKQQARAQLNHVSRQSKTLSSKSSSEINDAVHHCDSIVKDANDAVNDSSSKLMHGIDAMDKNITGTVIPNVQKSIEHSVNDQLGSVETSVKTMTDDLDQKIADQNEATQAKLESMRGISNIDMDDYSKLQSQLETLNDAIKKNPDSGEKPVKYMGVELEGKTEDERMQSQMQIERVHELQGRLDKAISQRDYHTAAKLAAQLKNAPQNQLMNTASQLKDSGVLMTSSNDDFTALNNTTDFKPLTIAIAPGINSPKTAALSSKGFLGYSSSTNSTVRISQPMPNLAESTSAPIDRAAAVQTKASHDIDVGLEGLQGIKPLISAKFSQIEKEARAVNDKLKQKKDGNVNNLVLATSGMSTSDSPCMSR